MSKFKTLYDPADKVVSIFNQRTIVPSWTNFVAVDSDGLVYAFSDKPSIDENEWVSDFTCELIGSFDSYPDWKNSLHSL